MRKPDERAPLAGIGVLVARPAGQSAGLARAVRALGGHALCFPLLTIVPAADPDSARAALRDASSATLVVFTSVNAVRGAFELQPGLADLLASAPLSVAAIGAATADALREARVRVDVSPSVADRSRSEELLARPELASERLRGRVVLIVKGEGGRALLAQRLAQRGARVVTAAVYRRRGASGDFRAFLRADGAGIRVAVITSAEMLERLLEAAGSEPPVDVRAWPLVVPSPRVARRARTLGFTGAIEVSDGVDDRALAAACVRAVHRPARGSR